MISPPPNKVRRCACESAFWLRPVAAHGASELRVVGALLTGGKLSLTHLGRSLNGNLGIQLALPTRHPPAIIQEADDYQQR
jgi:hypothetical protein